MPIRAAARPATSASPAAGAPGGGRTKYFFFGLAASLTFFIVLTLLGMQESRDILEIDIDPTLNTADGDYVGYAPEDEDQYSATADGPDAGNSNSDSAAADDQPFIPDTGPACRWKKFADFPPVDGERHPQKVIYVKTPKTGSSTASNVLARYTIERGGNVLHIDPEDGEVIFSEDDVVKGMRMDGVTNVSAFVNHIRYNETLTMKYLAVTAPDGTIKPPFRVTSLREPRDRLVSGYFYAVHRHTQGVDPAWLCGDLAMDYKKWVAECRFQTMRDYISSITWSNEDRHNLTMIQNHYDHILITDFMTESLLVLARKIGLSLFDMLILPEKANSRTDYVEQLGEQGLADLTARIKTRVDTQLAEQEDDTLYKMALAQHKKDFAQLPESMRKAEQDMETILEELTEYCSVNYKWERWQRYVTCIKAWMDAQIYC